jgi:hypothetical protein
MTTTLTIEEREASLRHLWLPEMSLSSARSGRRSATYVLAVDRDTILSALSAAYDRLVEEGKEDDEVTGTTTDALGQAGYPPLVAVLDQPEVLSEVLGGYLRHDLFAAVLPPASHDVSGTWAIDTVETVHRDGERVVLEGTCYAF